MKKRKKKEENQKNLIILGIVVLCIFIISFLIYLGTNKSEEEKVLNQEGYTTTNEDDAFYKKIVTNNTLDDYYKDISSNKESSYEEYYFSKESYQFIELKMKYSNGVNTTLNITSDLRTDEVVFNYESNYQDAHLLMEGSSKNDYSCQIIVQKNVNDSNAKEHCEYIMQEISIFLQRKAELLQNEKIREIVNQPIKEYTEE